MLPAQAVFPIFNPPTPCDVILSTRPSVTYYTPPDCITASSSQIQTKITSSITSLELFCHTQKSCTHTTDTLYPCLYNHHSYINRFCLVFTPLCFFFSQSIQDMGNTNARQLYEANLPENFRRPQTDQYPSL